MQPPYVGRQKFLDRLKTLEKKGKASLVVIKGRRRVGKSRLVEEFSRNKAYYPFTGLPPDANSDTQKQLDHFAKQLSIRFQLPHHTYTNWTDAFQSLGTHLQKIQSAGPCVVLFDEISWMAHGSPLFLGQLKAWWDIHHGQFPHLILVLCGSVSSWIEENILKSTAFFGRISQEITLPPLTLPECATFLRQNHVRGSVYEYYQILSIMGGIPWYLEQLTSTDLLAKQITHLCFEPDGILVNEFGRIFHDLFASHGKMYQAIVRALTDGMKSQAQLREETGYAQSGTFSHYMNNLILSGFVTEHPQWNMASGKISRQSLYRLSDQYTRFFLRYIEPHLVRIQQGAFETSEVSRLPGWDSMMGFQVESLLLQNRPLLLQSLGIDGQDIVCDNPYYQKPSVRRKGCQIDYLVQTRTRNFFVCEFKFMRSPIGFEIVREMEDKLKRFSAPRGYAKIPVLFHLGEVSASVYDALYFYRIVNIGDYLGL